MPDETTPATKADLQKVENRLGVSIQKLEGEFKKLEKNVQDGFTSLQRGIAALQEGEDQILTVLVNMDKHLSGRIEDHEIRIVHLEKAVAA